jgi:ABC-type antimicrobial peptide transport system permease subunit
MALGADRSTVRWMILKQSLWLAAIGLAAGLAAAAAGMKTLASLLYGVQPRDPSTLAAAAAVMLAVAALAGFLPARRAARLDPLVALRAECHRCRAPGGLKSATSIQRPTLWELGVAFWR